MIEIIISENDDNDGRPLIDVGQGKNGQMNERTYRDLVVLSFALL